MRFLLFLGTLIVLLACEEAPQHSSDLINYVPRKTAVIIKTTDYDALVSDLRNNQLVQRFEGTPLYRQVAQYSKLSQWINLKQEGLLCYTEVGKGEYEMTLITTHSPEIKRQDSTLVKETAYAEGNSKLKAWSSGDTTYYTLVIDEIFLLSTSPLLLENVLREGVPPPTEAATIAQAYEVTGSSLSVLLDGNLSGDLWRDILPQSPTNAWRNKFSWISVDIAVSPEDITFNGILKATDSVNQQLALFKDTQPVPNKIGDVAPVATNSLITLTHNNWEQYLKNLILSQGNNTDNFSTSQDSLFATFDEVSRLGWDSGTAIVAHTTAILGTETQLPGTSAQEDFRQIKVFTIDQGVGVKNAFAKAYPILKPLPEMGVYSTLDDFYVFAETRDALEQLIANYLNRTTLSQNGAFTTTMKQLSSASSVLMIERMDKKGYADWAGEKTAKTLQKMDIESYPYAALQLIQERDFMHLNGVAHKYESAAEEGVISQIASIKLDSDIIMGPQLVKNHRTKGMDVVVQDTNHRVYLISNTGRILWNKELRSPILGKVSQVDLYRNGRLQLAFTTTDRFYVLDRNGNDVGSFPLHLGNGVTQALAVFDYENNRNYRFVVTLGNEVTMFDKEGKQVKGFKFNGASSPILYPPKHIRLGSKDYILIAENTGKLHVLSRTGSDRVRVTDSFDFGDTPLFKDSDRAFGLYDVNGAKVSISQSGKLSETLAYTSATRFAISSGATSLITDNELYINEQLVTLDYGTYTAPLHYKVGTRLYTTVTNTETHQVYVFRDNGQPLEHTPVYGMSPASMGYLERNKSLGFAVKGDSDTILIYKVN